MDLLITSAWIEALLSADRDFFLLINGAHSPFLDALLPWWREKSNWIPLYLLLSLGLIGKFGWRGFMLVLLTGVAVGLGDYISSSVIKPAVGRLRPCNSLGFQDQVRLVLEGCGVGKSFPSSHATNHFALAGFLRIMIGGRYNFLTAMGMVWALIVAWAQVYVGVHYPLDVLAGALLGWSLAWLVSRLLFQLRPEWRSHFSGSPLH